MVSLIIAAFVSLALAITENERALIKEINSNPLSTWKAKEYPEDVITTEKMRKRLIKPEFWKPKEKIQDLVGRKVDADTSFDARDVWGKLILPVRDQGQCGSCWAFAVAETTGDRIGIETGKSNGDYSPQDLVACDTNDEGCDGGYVDLSWQWVVDNGIALESCIPYASASGTSPSCPRNCNNGSAITRTKATKAYAVPYEKMQDELAANGPFEVAFDVYLDFEFYTSGVYQKWDSILNILMGGHAVLLSGWGVDGSTPYWLVQNSWAASWGEQGYFRIIRGTDECGIEDNGYAGLFN